MLKQFDELVVQLALVLGFLILFLDFSFQNFHKLGFQQHLLHCNEYLNYHLKDLTLGKLESDSILNDYIVVNELISVQED